MSRKFLVLASETIRYEEFLEGYIDIGCENAKITRVNCK